MGARAAEGAQPQRNVAAAIRRPARTIMRLPGKATRGRERRSRAKAAVRLVDADSIRVWCSAVVMRPAGHAASIQEHRPQTDRGAERRVPEQHDPQQPRSFTAAHGERAETP